MKAAITTVVVCLVMALAGTAGAKEQKITAQTASKIVATWRCEDKIPRPHTRAYSPWKRHNSSFRRAELNKWTNRLNSCQGFLDERARQWNWQAWLPDHGRRLAICEQSLDWFATGHTQDGTFVSAFSISVAEYDKDAALMGVRPYYVKGKGVPSPWEQWQAARGHYKRWGDGWTGHCHGIMQG